MGYTNSSLVSTTILSPSNNHYGARTHVIDRITPHMVVGQCTATSLGNHFANPNRGATSNYGIAYDGKVGLYCEEKNAAGTSSSYANDNRAVTIEIASDTTYPYAITTAAYNTAVNLMADICKRNGKNKLVFIADKNTALNYSQASNEMLITFHKWFSATACPGFYLESHMAEMVAKVNAILGGSSNPAPAPTPIAKTTFDIAQEVIDNKWGNGQDRIDRLTKSGYDAKKIQNQVAQISPHKWKKQITQMKLFRFLKTIHCSHYLI